MLWGNHHSQIKEQWVCQQQPNGSPVAQYRTCLYKNLDLYTRIFTNPSEQRIGAPLVAMNVKNSGGWGTHPWHIWQFLTSGTSNLYPSWPAQTLGQAFLTLTIGYILSVLICSGRERKGVSCAYALNFIFKLMQ